MDKTILDTRQFRVSSDPWMLVQMLVSYLMTINPESPDGFWRSFTQIFASVENVTWDETILGSSAAHFVSALEIWLKQSHFNVNNILPSLQYFHVRCDTLRFLKAVLPWVSSSPVVSLRTSSEIPDSYIASCLDFLAERSLNMRYFVFKTNSRSMSPREEAMEALFGLLSHAPNLHSVSIPLDLLSSNVFKALSTLPFLQKLVLTEPTSPCILDYSWIDSMDCDGFPHLESLSICFASLKVVADIISQTGGELREVVISAQPLYSRNDLQDATTIIWWKCKKLRKFSLTIKNVPRGGRISWSDIYPLTCCHLLEEVEIQHDFPLCISNADIRTLLQFWQRATKISLNPRPRDPFGGELLSLECLYDVLSHTTLRQFGVYLGLRPSLDHQSLAAWSPRTTKIILDLGRTGGYSRDGVYDAARYLFSLAPCTQLVENEENSPWSREVAWWKRLL